MRGDKQNRRGSDSVVVVKEKTTQDPYLYQ